MPRSPIQSFVRGQFRTAIDSGRPSSTARHRQKLSDTTEELDLFGDEASAEHMPRSHRITKPGFTRAESTVGVEEGIHRKYEQVAEAIDFPSVYLIKAVRGMHSALVLNFLCFVVAFIQVIFPLWFLFNYSTRNNPRLIAPGFHKNSSETSNLRRRWLHNFSIEISSAIFLIYIAWAAWNRIGLTTFKFFMEAPRTRLRFSVLVFGFVAHVISVFCVVMMSYILIRVEPRPHELLLNAVALDYIGTFDVHVVDAFRGSSRLRKLLVDARSRLEIVADDLIRHGAIPALRGIEFASFCNLVRARHDRWPYYRSFEIAERITKQCYRFVCYALVLLAATGGHVAHSHVVNVLWFFHIVEHRAKPESNRVPFNNIRFQGKKGRRDRDYVPMAAFSVVVTYAVILLLLWLFERRKALRRRRLRPEGVFGAAADRDPETGRIPVLAVEGEEQEAEELHEVGGDVQPTKVPAASKYDVAATRRPA